MEVFSWREISVDNLPSKSGIYAWYYKMQLSKVDIENLCLKINSLNNEYEKRDCVEKFVTKYLFNLFQEDVYKVHIYGALKAEYKGKASHVNPVSSALIDKILMDTAVLFEIKRILENLGNDFASPLYIGMSENLAKRLSLHKRLIESYKANSYYNADDEVDADKNFAQRVVRKGFIETNLRVSITLVNSEGSMHNIMENLLNRINYPILGRN